MLPSSIVDRRSLLQFEWRVELCNYALLTLTLPCILPTRPRLFLGTWRLLQRFLPPKALRPGPSFSRSSPPPVRCDLTASSIQDTRTSPLPLMRSSARSHSSPRLFPQQQGAAAPLRTEKHRPLACPFPLLLRCPARSRRSCLFAILRPRAFAVAPQIEPPLAPRSAAPVAPNTSAETALEKGAASTKDGFVSSNGSFPFRASRRQNQARVSPVVI
jgi:hypothetical protein